MDRGVSSGGGQSSLGYLFGGDEALKSAEKPAPVQKRAPSSSAEKLKEIPAGIESSKVNNYRRAEGQNCGNFLTKFEEIFPLQSSNSECTLSATYMTLKLAS